MGKPSVLVISLQNGNKIEEEKGEEEANVMFHLQELSHTFSPRLSLIIAKSC